MADSTKLSKEGLNKVWLKVMELIKSLVGDVNTTKGTLQEQVNTLNSDLKGQYLGVNCRGGIINGFVKCVSFSNGASTDVYNLSSFNLPPYVNFADYHILIIYSSHNSYDYKTLSFGSIFNKDSNSVSIVCANVPDLTVNDIWIEGAIFASKK